jgi:ATP-dependent exoDNAse (exonuclease V) alpha subunit
VQGISREALWCAVEIFEKRRDAQTARELYVSIPRELAPDERLRLVREFVKSSFVDRGMVADISFHSVTASDQGENCHAHIMLTMRPLTPSGFGPKSRHEHVPDPAGRTHPDGRVMLVSTNKDSWNSAEFYESCRLRWETLANAALERAGSSARIDRRSLLEQGISRIAEPWLGAAYYMKEVCAAMRVRFGQFQAARHWRAVERRALTALQPQIGPGTLRSGETVAPQQLPDRDPTPVHRVERYIAWFQRQLDRLPVWPSDGLAQGVPVPERATPSPQRPSPDLER